ncbi:MAG: aminotransferase class I/II-fold pyridoxal phosphate-dependent enzyme, partial [Solirubrobacterales bacterium]|nr:aminotransferase class I/II-fold pyridoxal phosphate-dependent enzyme [Solirubrobacterales bacterium]
QFAGARRRVVTLAPPDFRLDPAELADAVSDRTRMILLNSPHNPTGRVLTRDELEAVARLAREHDLIVVTDEVYEHLIFEGRHIPLCTLAPEHTLTISSLSKSYAFTGWKTGWASGPAHLVGAARTVKQFLSFAGGTPFQHAAAVALGLDTEPLRKELQQSRDLLAGGLEAAGFDVLAPQATYFLNVDVHADAVEFCKRLVPERGVVAIPTSVFYDSDVGDSLVRFAFCKRPDVIAEAARRLGS